MTELSKNNSQNPVRIGVFDSGVGGLSVVNAIKKALPDAEVIYVEDKENVPYGSKSVDELRQLVMPIFRELATRCDVIVVACNTITTTLIKELRATLDVPLVGMEPMVKPAAEQSKTGVIAVCATPATLHSERYNWLKATYAQHTKVLEPDCSDWATMVEKEQVDRDKIKQTVESVIVDGADVIVLGCTHFHWIEDIIRADSDGRATVIQPEEPVIRQLFKVLETIRPAQVS